MTWSETLVSLCGEKKPALVTTATTGVGEQDKLIAVYWCDIDGNNPDYAIRKVTDAELVPAQKYHGVTSDLVRSNGLDDDVFVKYVNDALSNRISFTYNLAFQHKFLTRTGIYTELMSLPFIIQHAAMGSTVQLDSPTVQDLCKKLSKIDGNDPTMRAICRIYSVPFGVSVPGLLPLEIAGGALFSLLEMADRYPCNVTVCQKE